jgi:hypothetical protein
MTADVPPDDERRTPAAAAAAGCGRELSVLAHGDLRGWRGLGPDCARSQVDQVLSQVAAEVNESRPYSGPLEYAPTPGAPHGLTVNYAEGLVEYIIVPAPTITPPVQDALGEPDLTLPSYLEGSREQWAYPRQGLACHMTPGGADVNCLYAFVPMSAQDYQNSLLSRVRTLRHRRRATP